MTEAYLLELLRARYKRPAYAFFTHVRNQTGFILLEGAERQADALAVSLYPSRGIELIGFEVKVSRSDWRRELADPSKAEAFTRYCHRWYVVSPRDVIHRDELPEGWGLLWAHEGTIRQKREAALREPLPPTWSFFAALARALDKESR